MTFNYLARRNKASALVAKFGMVGILSQGNGVIGPAWASSPAPPIESAVSLAVIAQTEVPATDGFATALVKAVIIAVPATTTPRKGDMLVFADVGHEILECQPFAPAGVVVFYEAKCRA